MSRIHPKDLDVGSKFVEYDSFCGSVTAVCTQKPTQNVDGDGKVKWRWKAQVVGTGRDVDYLLTEGFEHYGPRIYREDSVLLPRKYKGE